MLLNGSRLKAICTRKVSAVISAYIVLLEFPKNYVQLAIDYSVQNLPLFVETVVGDTVLREVVGTDFFGSHPSANLGSSLIKRRLLSFLFKLPKFSAQNFKSQFSVLSLMAFLAALDYSTAGFMG